MDFQEWDPPSLAESTQSAKPSGGQQTTELWEVVEEPRGRLGAEGIMPERQEGHLLKKRKWPLKGWHKRYFVLEDGILHYATTRQDITKGKPHGSIDVRLSVMSINKKAQRIDLDTEDNIYHLKIKSQDLFQSWVAQLRAHRSAQHLDVPRSLLPSTTHQKVPGAQPPAAGSASALPGVGPREKVSSWLRDSDGLDHCSHELLECQGKLQELHRLLQSLESLHRIPSAPVIPTHQASVTTERPKKGKRTSRMWCTQSFAKDDTIGRVGRLHGSVPNLSRYLESRDPSGPRGLPPPDYAHLQRSFWALAQKGGAVGPPRRRCLPAASGPGTDVSLWNILRNNIGKDLSKVSMPVQLNEPLNTLQRLCEELEYSSLLDRASRTADPCERMVYIAAFAVSAYSSTYHRAGCKPFNPVLGETYECERPDRGFRFISEQVQARKKRAGGGAVWMRPGRIQASRGQGRGENTLQTGNMKWKNKFWGKSLEIVPVGTVNVSLPRFGDHFEWNKVTSCIHNILSGQRWIEHYGEVLIRNTQDSSCHCKLTFCKAKYWSSNIHEVQGAVFSRSGRVLHRLFGKWHEGLYRGPPPGGQCIWKPNSMPPNYERNFGFTQFALELNELTTELKRSLPSTDTRLRPDQRYLEEGNIQAAEAQKRRIEQLQRDRRKVMEENNIVHQARFFRRQTDSSGKEWWVTNNTYWRLRAEPGYGNLDGAVLW
ncbi:hypothetical protein G4228_003658 [Cervus hanglu yarkandensis]|nr:hypothetical protein G4228_003658 [Cervus hanglu yarkandensis]